MPIFTLVTQIPTKNIQIKPRTGHGELILSLIYFWWRSETIVLGKKENDKEKEVLNRDVT